MEFPAAEAMADQIRACIAVVPFRLGNGDERVNIEFHACGLDFEAEITTTGQLRSVSLEPAQRGPSGGET